MKGATHTSLRGGEKFPGDGFGKNGLAIHVTREESKGVSGQGDCVRNDRGKTQNLRAKKPHDHSPAAQGRQGKGGLVKPEKGRRRRGKKKRNQQVRKGN